MESLSAVKRRTFSPTDMNLILAEWEEYKKDSRRKLKEKRTEISKRYGYAVKLERARRGISQTQFSELIGMSYSHFSKLESGHVLVSPRLHLVIIETLQSIPEPTYDGRVKTVYTNSGPVKISRFNPDDFR
jgi:ribosome-binding protein aMBF1 (putative translation factor)